jgi:hypothetical protein
MGLHGIGFERWTKNRVYRRSGRGGIPGKKMNLAVSVIPLLFIPVSIYQSKGIPVGMRFGGSRMFKIQVQQREAALRMPA